MKKTEQYYDYLKDAFLYTVDNWLDIDLTDDGKEQAYYIIGAVSFLLDSLYIKENAGTEITSLVKQDVGIKHFRAPTLLEKATKIRTSMNGDEYKQGTSPLRTYIDWVCPIEPTVLEAYKDEYGMLAIELCEELINVIVTEKMEVPQLRISELVFLNMMEEMRKIYAEAEHERFRIAKSYSCFDDISSQMERIRSEIDK